MGRIRAQRLPGNGSECLYQVSGISLIFLSYSFFVGGTRAIVTLRSNRVPFNGDDAGADGGVISFSLSLFLYYLSVKCGTDGAQQKAANGQQKWRGGEERTGDRLFSRTLLQPSTGRSHFPLPPRVPVIARCFDHL